MAVLIGEEGGIVVKNRGSRYELRQNCRYNAENVRHRPQLVDSKLFGFVNNFYSFFRIRKICKIRESNLEPMLFAQPWEEKKK